MKSYWSCLLLLIPLAGCQAPLKKLNDHSPTLTLYLDASQGSQSGRWDLTRRTPWKPREGERLNLQIQRTGHSARYQYSSLAVDQLQFSETPIIPHEILNLNADAGSLVLSQTKGDNPWTGTARLEADPRFGDVIFRMTKEGLNSERLLAAIIREFKLKTLLEYQETEFSFTQNELWTWLSLNIPAADASKMREANPRLSASDVVQLRRFGVPVRFVQQLPDFSANDLIQFKRFGVEGEYVQAFRQFNPEYMPDNIIALKRFGVPISWAESLAGLSKVRSHEDLIHFRKFGLSPDFVRAAHATSFARERGDFIQLRQHGISSAFLESLTDVDPSTTTQDIIRLHRAGIRSEDQNAMRAYGITSIDDMLRLKRHGVGADFIRAIRIDGRPPLTADAIIDLKTRGIGPQTIRALRQ